MPVPPPPLRVVLRVWLGITRRWGSAASPQPRLEHLRRLDVPEGLFHAIPPHRITRLRRQGERATSPTVSASSRTTAASRFSRSAPVEWEVFLADAVVETHDRIVGRTYREAARTCEARLGDETAAVREALHAFAELGTALIGARGTGEALDAVIADGPGWEGLGDLVAKAAALANTAVSDPLNHVLGGYSRFPTLHAANAAHAGHRGVARGRALAGSGRRPAQRRHGAAYPRQNELAANDPYRSKSASAAPRLPPGPAAGGATPTTTSSSGRPRAPIRRAPSIPTARASAP